MRATQREGFSRFGLVHPDLSVLSYDPGRHLQECPGGPGRKVPHGVLFECFWTSASDRGKKKHINIKTNLRDCPGTGWVPKIFKKVGRGTRNGYEASKGSEGISGL